MLIQAFLAESNFGFTMVSWIYFFIGGVGGAIGTRLEKAFSRKIKTPWLSWLLSIVVAILICSVIFIPLIYLLER